MRVYLEYMMKANGIKKNDIQKLLNVSEKTVRNKLSGETDFTWGEAKKIRNTFFATEEYDKLFEQIPKMQRTYKEGREE